MLFWLSIIACQEPFGFDRHDLQGFRIAAVTSNENRPRVAVFVDGRPWSDEPVQLRWFRTEGPGQPLGPSIGTGPRPDLTGHDWVAVVATHAEEERRADLDLADRTSFAPDLASFSTEWRLDSITAEELTLDGRPAPLDGANNSVGTDFALRVHFAGGPEDTITRFMATGGGTFFEAGARQADWFAADVTVDDDTIDASPIEPGPITFLALGIAEHSSGFAQHDVFVGPPLVGSWTPDGRFVEGGIEGFYTAVLEPVESVLAVRATQVEPASAATSWEDGGLACSGPRGLELSGLLDQRCTRSQLIGRRVLLQGVE